MNKCDKHPKQCEESYYRMSKKEALLLQNFLYSHQVIDLPGWKDAENAYQSILSRTPQHSSSGSPCVTERREIKQPVIGCWYYDHQVCGLPHPSPVAEAHDRVIEQTAREDERNKVMDEVAQAFMHVLTPKNCDPEKCDIPELDAAEISDIIKSLRHATREEVIQDLADSCNYRISTMINGGARIHSYLGGIIRKSPEFSFEISPENKEKLYNMIESLRIPTTSELAMEIRSSIHPRPSGTSPICEKCTSGTGPFCSGCYHLHQLPQYVPWSELRMIEALEHIASTGSIDAINAYIAECRKQAEERAKGM